MDYLRSLPQWFWIDVFEVKKNILQYCNNIIIIKNKLNHYALFGEKHYTFQCLMANFWNISSKEFVMSTNGQSTLKVCKILFTSTSFKAAFILCYIENLLWCHLTSKPSFSLALLDSLYVIGLRFSVCLDSWQGRNSSTCSRKDA